MMKITQVVVEIHEKRNHPNAYGHYDARVSYTAELLDGEYAADTVEKLQFVARQQVAAECDRWIEEIKTREAQESARRDLQWIVDRLENRLPNDHDTADFEGKIALLPGGEHPEWRDKLAKAQAEFLSRIKSDLDRIAERVGRRGATARDEGDFGELMARLPEDEHQGYIDKMSDAIAARDATKAAQIAQSNEIMGTTQRGQATEPVAADSGVEFAIEFDDDSDKKEEVPF